MKKIAIIGECMVELTGEPFGTMRQNYGGDALNSATYLVRCSSHEQIEVRFVSAMGTDNLSSQMLACWQEDGVNTDWVLIDPMRQPGLYLIQLDTEGERTFLYWRNQSAARYLLQHPDYSKVLSELKNMDMIYLSGISLAVLPENDRLLLIKQLTDLAKQGVEIAFDSNYRAALWESAEKTREIYTALLPVLSLALVTFDDEKALWQDKDEAATIARLKQNGVKTVVVKSGKRGAAFSDQSGEIQQVPTTPITHVVDTSSAGDSFNAGFLNGYLQGKDLITCCQQGNRLAAIVIQHKGAIIDKKATEHLVF